MRHYERSASWSLDSLDDMSGSHFIRRNGPLYTAAVVLAAACASVAVTSPSGAASRVETQRVSVRSDGSQAGRFSASASISASGRFVAFESLASDLVDDDTNATYDVFVHDRRTGLTRRVSVHSDGSQLLTESGSPSISADGRFVAFTAGVKRILVHDLETGKTQLVSVSSRGRSAGGWTLGPVISGDGRYVAFFSLADNLVPNDTNDAFDVFVRDRVRGVTRRVSVSSNGTEANGASSGPSISADGRFVAFHSEASNLVPGDTNGAFDVFVRNRSATVTRRVSVSSNEREGNHDSYQAVIAAGGRFVAFRTDASDLIPDDTNQDGDVLVRDRQLGTTTIVSITSSGAQVRSQSYDPAISAGGRFVVFQSSARKFSSEDTNDVLDVFIHDRATGRTRRVSLTTDDLTANGRSFGASISARGTYVAFTSEASNLVPADTNAEDDIFVRGALR
jgi:Tol biopolymer transport system component